MDIDNRSLLITIGIHAALLLVFFLAAFVTPLPLPAEEGILVNFGDVEAARGNNEPKFNEEKISKPKQEEVKEKTKEVKAKEKIMTQDYEEAAAIKEEKKSTTKKSTKTKTEVKKPVPEKKVEQKKEEEKKPEPVVNKNALYRGRKTTTQETGSEGVSSGQGNQGSLAGSENATDRSLSNGSGNGASYDLAGRNALSLAQVDIKPDKEGKVVVEIRVDRAGNVISAVPGVKGSTTLESSLLSAAKRAALASKFDSKQDAETVQVGRITYYFKY